jgi:predicted ester cyclase
MSVQENSRINEALFAAVNAHDIDGYLNLVSDDIVMRDSRGLEPTRGKDAVRLVLEGLFATFPDYHIELKNVVVSEEQYVSELEFSGTHDGPFSMGPGAPPLAPTGNKVRTLGIFVATVAEGKIVEMRQYPNYLGMLTQLGVISPPGSN